MKTLITSHAVTLINKIKEIEFVVEALVKEILPRMIIVDVTVSHEYIAEILTNGITIEEAVDKWVPQGCKLKINYYYDF